MKSIKKVVINVMRRIVDKYDNDNGLKKKKVFPCSNCKTRNDRRREPFKIPIDQVQCPTYKDNRCCGSCDLAPTCDYATNCNCYGMAKGVLGGTTEGYYMRETDMAEYGRIIGNDEFDWDFYYRNRYADKFSVGKYIAVQKIEKTKLSEDTMKYLNDNGIVAGKIIKQSDDEGVNIIIDFTESNNGKELILPIRYSDIAYNGVYETFEEVKIFNRSKY